MVDSWAGPRNETHDFYIGSNAVEVKTTVKHAPYQAHINSEYQLDKKMWMANYIWLCLLLGKILQV